RRNRHGAGCTLAAAITAALALGDDLKTAVVKARAFVFEAMRAGPTFGDGEGPLWHRAGTTADPSAHDARRIGPGKEPVAVTHLLRRRMRGRDRAPGSLPSPGLLRGPPAASIGAALADLAYRLPARKRRRASIGATTRPERRLPVKATEVCWPETRRCTAWLAPASPIRMGIRTSRAPPPPTAVWPTFPEANEARSTRKLHSSTSREMGNSLSLRIRKPSENSAPEAVMRGEERSVISTFGNRGTAILPERERGSATMPSGVFTPRLPLAR